MNKLDVLKYRWNKVKSTASDGAKAVTPEVIRKSRSLKKLGVRLFGDKKKMRQLRRKIVKGTATEEDKLNFRLLNRADGQNKFQGATAVASKVALASAPVTGGLGGIAAGTIGGVSTAVGVGDIAIRGSIDGNKKLASKKDSELTDFEKSRKRKARELAEKVTTPEYRKKIKEEERHEKAERLKMNLVGANLRKEKAIKEAKEREIKTRSKNGFTGKEFDVIHKVMTNDVKNKNNLLSKSAHFIKEKIQNKN